jgi:hypothetical protein
MSDLLKTTAAAVANEMRSAPAELSADLRGKFIAVRSALFQRGIYDPVLVRFDSATVPHATREEIAAQLAAVAESL